MDAFSADLRGFDALERNLQRLPQGLASKVLGPAVRAGGKEILEEARRLAPRGTGFLADEGIVIRRADEAVTVGNFFSKGSVRFVIATVADAFYGMFREFGTVRQAAVPFMRPALESKAARAIDVIKARLWTGIKRIARLQQTANQMGERL